ncbi:MAG: thioredoxin family protein [Balneolaceae bacterium]
MTDVKSAIITRNIIENGYSYSEYRDLIENLLEQGKTTGENHSEAMLHYTKMNSHRMRRIDNRVVLDEKLMDRLAHVKRSMTWLILTEAWCGDAAQSIPAIQKIADQTPKIHTRYILRDENPDIIDRFLTNGKSRSIPILICLDSKTLEILGSWGPRSEEAQQFYDETRQIEGIIYQEVAEKLHKWYADDSTKSVQHELLHLIDRWENN